MVLTKHLYRHDEVCSAFLYCLKQRRYEAQFWLYELEASGFDKDVKTLLLIAWTMRVGLTRVSWLQHWSATANIQNSRILLCEELLSIPDRDASIWWLLWYGATSEKRPSIPLKKAILEKNLSAAWWYLSRFEENIFWTTVQKLSIQTPVEPLIQTLRYGLESYTIFGRCIAVAILFTYETIGTSSWKEIKIPISRNTQEMYTSLHTSLTSSIKSHRLYAIPWECLFGMTYRGSGNSTLSELYDVETQFLESPIWNIIMKSYQSENSWMDENVRNLFYEKYFPYEEGDIPDEWSLVEKQKSHDTCMSIMDEPVFTRWWRNWTIQERLYIWNKDAFHIQEWMNETYMNMDENVLDTLEKIYQEHYVNNMGENFEKMVLS